jgi:hypothetical protein
MKIFVFSDGVRHGCYVYREEIPLEALERRGHLIDGGCPPGSELLRTKFSDGGSVAHCDLFVFPRLAALDYPLVIDDLKRNGKPVVYEMDDAADLYERFHTSYFQVRNLLPSYYFFLHEADLVTTTTDTLAEHFRSLGAKRVVVLPNCPVHSAWPELRPMHREPVRIGYTGWTGHMLEASFWMEVMAALRQIRTDFIPVLFGISTPSDTGPQWLKKCHQAVNQNPIPNYDFGQVLHEFEQSYRKVANYMEWHSMTDVDAYWNKLWDLRIDIGCAPLLDTAFNRCKSPVKFYDYAGAGAVTLASDVLPYSTEPILTVPNQVDAWVRMLSLLIDNAQHRQLRLQEQRAWIRENRDPDKWAIVREQAYESLLGA